MKWFFLLLVVPIIEIVVFFEVNELLGTFYTILIIISTAFIGTLLVQNQGKKIIFRLKYENTNPIHLLGSGFLIFISGILLLTPGFITDIIGFFLLYPKIRQKIIRHLSKKFTPY
jgi:UPF0716 protein FxsA